MTKIKITKIVKEVIKESMMDTSLDTYKIADSFTQEEIAKLKSDGKISDEVVNGALELQRAWKKRHPSIEIGNSSMGSKLYKKQILQKLYESINKKEALKAINNDFLQFVTSLGGTHEVQSHNTNVVIIDFKKNYGEEAEFEYNLVTKSLHPAGISRPEDDKASALYDKLWKEKAKIFRKYIEMNPTD